MRLIIPHSFSTIKVHIIHTTIQLYSLEEINTYMYTIKEL